MKKLLIATAVMFCVGASLVRADKKLIPTGENNALATADYGGVIITTFTPNLLISGAGVGFGTATIGGNSGVGGVWYGAYFSSGTTFDFVDIWDSTSADNAKNRDTFVRVYNISLSTGGAGAYASGFSGPPKPIQYNKGLIYRPSRADFNSLNIMYYQAP